MAGQQTRRDRGRIGRGLLLSIFLHAQVLVPLVAWVFWWGKPADDEVGLSFESIKDDELPPNLPVIEKPAEPTKATKAVKLPERTEKPSTAKPPPPEALAERAREPEPPPPEPGAPKPPETPGGQPEEVLGPKRGDRERGKEGEAPEDAK